MQNAIESPLPRHSFQSEIANPVVHGHSPPSLEIGKGGAVHDAAPRQRYRTLLTLLVLTRRLTVSSSIVDFLAAEILALRPAQLRG